MSATHRLSIFAVAMLLAAACSSNTTPPAYDAALPGVDGSLVNSDAAPADARMALDGPLVTPDGATASTHARFLTPTTAAGDATSQGYHVHVGVGAPAPMGTTSGPAGSIVTGPSAAHP